MKKNKRQHLYVILLLLITVIGAVPRAIEVLNGNYLFGFDQGVFYLAVKSIIVDKHVTLIGTEVGGIGGFFQGPGWYYLLTVPFVLFKGDPYGGMILMFLLGVGSICLSIILFRKLLGLGSSLLVGFFIALSSGIISQARFIWPPFLITPLTILFLFFVCKSYLVKDVTSKKMLWIPLVFLILGIMTHFEIATGISLLLATSITLFTIRPKGIFKTRIILLSFLAFVFTQLPLILFDLRHNFIGLRGILAFLTQATAKAQVTYSFQNHIDMYKDGILSVSFTIPMAAIFILVVILCMKSVLKDKKAVPGLKSFILFLIITPLVLFMEFLPLKMTLWSWWFLELPIYFCFLLGISFNLFIRSPRWKYLAFIILAVYFVMFSFQVFQWYKKDLPDYGGTAKIKGRIDALDYIYKDASQKKFGLFVFSPPVYTYPYDYLLWWYGKNKYGYVPSHEKKQTFYLLIEPDSVKPWSYKGWLKTVIKDGKIIKTVTLPSGFIIQKRTLQ